MAFNCRRSVLVSLPAIRRVSVLAALGLSLAAVSGAVQVPFGPQQIVSDITLGARAVVAGDIDGDGDLDLVTASSTDNAIGWHDNDGSGNFSVGELLSNSFTGARSVALGDIDGDGDLDAVAAARTLATLAWFQNDGTGDFAPEVAFETGFAGVRSVALADADGDGDLDVFAGGDSSSLIAWYENTDGAGTFGGAQVISTAALFVQEVSVADVDGDGDLDLLSASAIDNKVAWYANDGLGGFGPQQVLTTDADDARSVTTADIDGDGDTDVVATSQDDDTVFWIENLGGGAFGPKQVISDSEEEPQTVVTADLDRDGDIDVATILEAGNALVWYENSDGLGDFLPAQIVTDVIDAGESLTIADLDGDGDPDAVSASTNDSRIAWYENGTARSSASYLAPIAISTDASGVERVRLGDVDGDGDSDVVAALEGSGEIVWYENDGVGSFGEPLPVSGSYTGARDLNLADIDGDGDLDVAASAGAESRVSWFENLDGAGTFGGENPIDIASLGAEEVDFGDLDRDGDPDLLVASMGDDSVAWFENLGGTFGARRVITGTALGVRSVEAVDLDGDGDVDVLYAAADANRVGWHPNLGGGAFAPLEIIDDVSLGPFAIDAGDIDGDGDPDIAAVANLGGEVSWYQNGGDGVWERRLIDSTFSNPADIEAIDVDRDGDLDFLVAAAGSNVAAWFENLEGIGTFGPPIVLTDQADGAESIVGADLDGDGDVDITAAAMVDDAIRWFTNCGGQYGVDTSDSAPVRLLQSGRDDLLTITVTNNGTAGSPFLSIERIRLLLEDEPGVPMNDIQAVDLFESISIFRDDGSGLFERANDISVAVVSDVGLVNGEISIDLPDGILNQVFVGEPGTFYAVLALNADAAEKDPSSFYLTHQIEGSEGTLVTYLEGTPAVPECPATVTSREVTTGSLQIAVSGPCPGNSVVTVTGGNSNDSVAIVSAAEIGLASVPVGECLGEELSLDQPTLFRITDFDASGTVVLQFNAPAGVCGRFLQALDLQNCARSNVDVVGLHPPVAQDLELTTDEDVSGQIMLVATDVDEDELTFSIVDPPVEGSLQGTPPDIAYLPNENYFGPDVFTYIANDGQFDSEVATVTITVNPVNDPPVAFDDSVETAENAPLAIALTASDVEDDPLTYELVDLPANGALTGDAPNVTYTPDNGFFGADSFTFRVNDGELDSNLATISIGVTQVNEPPIAENGAVTTDEDVATPVTLVASDPDLDPLEYSIVDGPTDGAVSGTPPNVTYTPNENFNGVDSFTFLVNDGLVDSNLATITLTVNAVNDPPVANDQSVSTDEDVALPIELVASDVDLDPLTYAIVDPPSGGEVTGTPPSVTYTPSENFNGSDSFTFVANDGAVDSNVASVSISVAPINDPPEALDQSVTTPMDMALTITLEAIDPEDDPVQYQLVSAPTNGTVAGATPDVVYTPDPGFSGTDSFVFRSFDGELISNDATVTITVEAVNQPPVADDQSVVTDEDVALPIVLTASDPELDPLTWSVVNEPTNGVLSGTAPNVTYTPDPDFNGSDSFTFRVNDGEFDSNVATVSITVNAINDPPVADDQSVTTERDTPIVITLTASDVEEDPITYELIDSPPNGDLNDPPPQVTYTPNPGFVGTDTFTFVANDGELDSEIATVTITVTEGNLAPTAVDQSVETDEDVAVGITLSGDDPELDPLSYVVENDPSNGVLSGTAPDLVYTPDPDYHGSDSFTFTVDDGEFTSAPATVTITVDPVNDPPLADDQSLATNEDSALVIVLTGSDIELDPLTFAVVDGPSDGVLSGTAPNMTYTPTLDFNGVDSFTYTANDGDLTSDPATVTITVAALNDPPEADDQSVATDEDVSLAIVLTGSDVELDPLTFSVVDPPSSGTLEGAEPDLTYVPNKDFNGADSFTYLANDGTDDSAIATVSISVVPINDDPILDPVSVVGPVNQPIEIDLTASDVEGDVLTFSIDSEPASGTLSAVTQLPPDAASVTYTPDPGFMGLDSFAVLVDDGAGGQDTATVDVEITP